MKQRAQIPHAPMAIIVIMFACGIIIAHFIIEIPLFVWFLCSCIMLLCGVIQSRFRWLFTLLAVGTLGGANLRLRHTSTPPPQQTTINTTIEISNMAKRTSWEDWNSDVAIVEWSDTSNTHRCNRKLKATYKADTPYPAGTRLKCKTVIKPIDNPNYANVLTSRGFEGYATLTDIQPIGHRNTLRYYAQSIQQSAIERVHRLGLEENEERVAEAMILGYRGNMNSTLRQEYAESGSSHILAVSGLHVGIVFILINAILWLLPMIRYGHIAKNIIAIILIWGFTFVSGLSPSAVRAAFMFTLLQLGFAMSVTNNPLNAIGSAALFMLVIDPMYLFDISFQLSFIAVIGISLWFKPLYLLIQSESRLLNGIWSMLLVSFCASIAVMPLIAFTFGQISFVGILLSPIVVVLAHISILVGLVWCMMPLELLKPIVHFVLQHSLEWQNRLMGATSDLSFVSIDWQPSIATTIAIYAGYSALTIALFYLTRNHKQPIVFE